MTEVEAPDLAAVIQRGFPFDEGVVQMVRSYCEPLKQAEVDTVILGCTHYPLVAPMLQRMLGRDVSLVTAGHAIAATAQRVLEESGLTKTGNEEGTYRFLCTGTPRPSGSWARASCRCRWVRSSAWSCPNGRFGVYRHRNRPQVGDGGHYAWGPFFPWGLVLIALGLM